ncbi:MAG TPA: ATP-binding protein [Spirochaetota bacterium]|nr:ATP-binding protein [Spirochaetota bacterium]HQF09159.1 ATP-binding protein [Spirochaetota bacterium]HQJ71404.1 ATP-binding protein [Spirochaetota bacterium]
MINRSMLFGIIFPDRRKGTTVKALPLPIFIDISNLFLYTTDKENAMDTSKMDHLDIILLCGLYGSGKTEFAMKYFLGKDRNRISRSDIRKSMYEMTNFGEKWTPDRFSEDTDALVKHIERKIVEHFSHQKKKILIINTYITKKSRQAIVDLARQTKKSIGAIFLNRPLEQCLERNAKSAMAVPQEIIYKLHSRIELPDKNEGFDEVMIVTYK